MRFYEYFNCDCKYTTFFPKQRTKKIKNVLLHLNFPQNHSKITMKSSLRLEYYMDFIVLAYCASFRIIFTPYLVIISTKRNNYKKKYTEFNFLAIYFPNIYCLFSIEDAFIFVSLTLIILFVTRYCPNSHDRGGNDESEDLMGDAQEITTSDEDGTD